MILETGVCDMGDVSNDQFVLIRIDGMHCHKCERAIQGALVAKEGVHEVEVDFATGQASVLFDRQRISVKELMEAVEEVGYRAMGFSQKADAAAL
jgi:copper chaperone CopZ